MQALCGQGEALALISQARELGLGVVFGNGVQTGIGNHLDAKVYLESGLDTAFEGNGFLQISEDWDCGGLSFS